MHIAALHIAALQLLLVACAALHGANNMSGESGSDILLSIRPRVPQTPSTEPQDSTIFQLFPSF